MSKLVAIEVEYVEMGNPSQTAAELERVVQLRAAHGWTLRAAVPQYTDMFGSSGPVIHLIFATKQTPPRSRPKGLRFP